MQPEQRSTRPKSKLWIKAVALACSPLGVAVVTLLAVGGFLFASSRAAGLGFPLDDAWIHQTYARSLAQTGQWAYFPGEPSAGSTSPLWSVLLAVGYWLHLNPLVWAYLLGGLSLWVLGLAGQRLLFSLAGDLVDTKYLSDNDSCGSKGIPWASLFLVGEWHLVWAALSGMETVLYAALILAALALIGLARGRRWFAVGVLVGLGVWLRPDALTLLGPAGMVLVLSEKSWRSRLAGLGWLSAGLLLLFVPYLGFNWQIQGSLWPNTFYAKQAEYAALQNLPWLQRFFDQIKMPLIGAGMFLLPGFARSLWLYLRRRNWLGLAAVIWFLGFAGLYAWRLPVTYQYGRYLIPAMPVYFVVGLAGVVDLVRLASGHTAERRAVAARAAWILTRTLAFSVAGIWLAFYGVVAGLYARDVAIIQTEMVAAAQWVSANTEPDALIAAHDIGALGYFGQRRLVDLAGLISPDVIPFLRDEDALARWMDQQQVDYLVTFTGWYDHLTVGKEPLYRSSGSYSLEAGGENMWVYRWRARK